MTRTIVSGLCAVLLWAGMAAAQSRHDVFAREWTPILGEQRAVFIAVNRFAQGLGLNEARIKVEAQPVSWSPGTQLIRVSGAWVPRNLFLYYLHLASGSLIPLDGSWDRIAQALAKTPPRLTAQSIGDYIWFTGFFLRGKEGPFLLFESDRDTFLPELDPEGAEVHEDFAPLSEIARPLDCAPATGAGLFRCRGMVYYSNSIFVVEYEVTAQGKVTMPRTRPVAVKLRYKIDAPINPVATKSFRPLP